MNLLQITTIEAPATDVPTVTEPSMSLLELLFKGGWVMLPILFLSLVAVFVIVERILALNRASKNKAGLLDSVKGSIMRAELNIAETTVSQYHTPVSEILLKGIKRIGSPVKEIESAMESTGRIEVMKLEKNMNLLGVIAAIAPMLGFVGTISGVIKIFYNISLADNISIGLIAGGLYEKMITSAAGLIVGIIAHTAFQLLNMKIESITLEMEKAGVEFIDIITEHK
jgi:biopolymer transport protein ExbB